MKSFSRQNPMLAEMLINLLFFAVCSCLLLGLFASAYRESENAGAQQLALEYAQSVAEEYIARGEAVFGGDWEACDSGLRTDRTFSKTQYSVFAEDIGLPDGIRGFRLSAWANGIEKFAFNVEVYTGQ